MIAAFLLSALIATASAHHAVTTASAPAQAAFDRGLTMLYSYNGDQASREFASALALDPHLAMAAWGEALAAGTDLNTPLDEARFARAASAARTALSLEAYASAPERAYIQAVGQRYAGTYADRETGEANYRAAMASLVQAYPLDDDAAMLDAEALMERLGTDRMWTADGTKPVPDAAQAIALITRVLQRDPDHIMANHLCIHAYDYASDRAPAVGCADRVASWSFLPGQEHLAHMPAHTYLEVGEYGKALEVSDKVWRLREQWDGQKYAAHDAYTGWSAAMMLGDLKAAQTWGARLGQTYDGSNLWATWARFGQWQQIADSSATGQFYAPLSRGLADVHFGNLSDARAMLALYANTDADYRWLLEAAIDERVGQTAAAIGALEHAIADQARDDGGETLPLFPAGEALGALYLRAGQYAQAADAFASTLGRYPNDPRALYGLSVAQQNMGQGVTSRQTLKSFERIWNDQAPPDLADL